MWMFVYLQKSSLAATLKKKEILPFATIWMNLEDIMLSEVSQAQKDKDYMISFICEFKKSNS